MRDFTYIDDIINGITSLVGKNERKSTYQLFNIGNNQPVKLMEFIQTIENPCNVKAQLKMLPMQDGDVLQTYADIDALFEYTTYKPNTSREQGIEKFGLLVICSG
jgi:UDP-glucuronate 4-epimerase